MNAPQEDAAAQILLRAVPRIVGDVWTFKNQRFRSDSGHARIGLLGLASLTPVDLHTGAPLALDQLFDGPAPIAPIVTDLPQTEMFVGSLANRAIHPPLPEITERIAAWARDVGEDAPALLSHAIDPAAAKALLAGDTHNFLHRRARSLERVIRTLYERYAAPLHSDRPDLRHLFDAP